MVKYINSFLFALCVLLSFSACEREEDITVATLTYKIDTIAPSYYYADIWCLISCNAPYKDVIVYYSTHSDFTDYKTQETICDENGYYKTRLTDLIPGTIYYVDYGAFNGVSYLQSKNKLYSFCTKGDKPYFGIGIFSVSPDTQVTFSPGNLQYNAANKEWRFAESQTAYIGESNRNISTYYYKWIDLFGWGTGDAPAKSSISYDYQTFVDWGVNQIGNDVRSMWRTLTASEWQYLRYHRSNADNLVGIAQVDGVNGLILLPDNWRSPEGITFRANFHDSRGSENYAAYQEFTSYQWSKLEAAGAVFLPAAGGRDGESVESVQIFGGYWSATENGSNSAFCLGFYSNEAHIGNSLRRIGRSVRLVKEIGSSFELPVVITSTITQITETSAVAGGNVTNDGGASVTERGVVYNTSANPSIEDLNSTIVCSGSGTGIFTCQLSNLQVGTTYYVRAYAVNSKGTAYGKQVSFTTNEQSSTPNDGTENSYVYVDLGLSVKWATCNVGANAPEEYGDYFAWGETTTKSTYNWSTYKYCNGSSSTFTKYNTSGSYGSVDNKTQLELSDDAAAVNWGGNWRMPTDAERTELRNNCTWEWTTQNGANGYKVTSKSNGNSIFLPAAGYRDDSSLYNAGSRGYYWSSSLTTGYPYDAYGLFFDSSAVGWYDYYRYYGLSVRPVCQ